MRARFVPFEAEHLDMFEPLDIYQGSAYKENYANYSSHPDVFLHTLLGGSNLKPIAVMGFALIFPRVASVWCVTGMDALKNMKEFALSSRSLINHYFESNFVDRAEVYMRCDQPWATRWGHFLGFEIEGTCRKYGHDGTDHYIMSKVRV